MGGFAVGNDELTNRLTGVASSGFPDFPGEHPSRAAMERWVTTWTEDMGTAGFGAFTRGEIPFEVEEFNVVRNLITVPSDPAAAAVIAGKNADIEAANDAMKLKYKAKLCELRNRLAAKISRAMRPNAKMRFKVALPGRR